MNILFLADIVPYPPNTGIKIRTYNIIRELANAGNNIFLIAFNHTVFIDNELTKKKYKEVLECICNEVHILEIPSDKSFITKYGLYLSNLFSSEPYRVQRYYSEECCSIIRDILLKNDIQICHADKLEFYKYSNCIGNIPIVATNHNVESDLMRQRVKREISFVRKFFAYVQWKKIARYESFALNNIAGYVTCSKIDAEFFQSEYGIQKPYVIVENGVDCDYYKPNKTIETENYFLIIGAQNKESTANYDATWFFLTEIWPIAKKSVNCKVIIVGRNPDKSIIEYVKKDLNVEVVGFMDDERDIFMRSRALIVPLRIGGGSRLKILTAFGLGKAVISTSKGAEGLDYNDGKDILIGDTPKEFATHMINLLNDLNQSKELGSEARMLALEKYDWKKLGLKLTEFYNYLK